MQASDRVPVGEHKQERGGARFRAVHSAVRGVIGQQQRSSGWHAASQHCSARCIVMSGQVVRAALTRFVSWRAGSSGGAGSCQLGFSHIGRRTLIQGAVPNTSLKADGPEGPPWSCQTLVDRRLAAPMRGLKFIWAESA